MTTTACTAAAQDDEAYDRNQFPPPESLTTVRAVGAAAQRNAGVEAQPHDIEKAANDSAKDKEEEINHSIIITKRTARPFFLLLQESRSGLIAVKVCRTDDAGTGH